MTQLNCADRPVSFVRDPGIDGANWPTFTPQQQDHVTLNYNRPEHRTMMKPQECQLWNKIIPGLQRISG